MIGRAISNGLGVAAVFAEQLLPGLLIVQYMLYIKVLELKRTRKEGKIPAGGGITSLETRRGRPIENRPSPI